VKRGNNDKGVLWVAVTIEWGEAFKKAAPKRAATKGANAGAKFLGPLVAPKKGIIVWGNRRDKKNYYPREGKR